MAKLNKTAGKLDLTIEQGTTFSVTLTYTDVDGIPIDLTGYSARMQIRSTVDSTITIHELTTALTTITLGGAAGTVLLEISDSDTESFTFSVAVYDLELISAGGVVSRLVEGKVTLSKEVTR